MNKFKFEITGKSFEGRLKYSPAAGFAFIYESDDPLFKHTLAHGEFALSKTLSLEFLIDSGILLSVDGYRPKQSWLSGTVQPPISQKGQVLALLGDYKITAGVAIPLDGLQYEELFFDDKSGWARIGAEDASEKIEITTGIIIGIEDSAIKAVWLKPEIEQTNAENKKRWWKR